MSGKALIIVGAVIAVLPFILYSFIVDLTKKQFFVLAAVTVVIGGMASTVLGRSILSWLGEPEHLLPLVLCLAALLIGFFSVRFAAIRRRRYRLMWPSKPSQREFAAACYDLLIRRSWTHRHDISRISFHVYWMQFERDRVTFVFSVGQLEIDSLLRLFGSAGLAPAKKVVLVLWEQPFNTMQAVFDRLGWRFMVIDDFKRPEANLTEAYKAVVRPAAGPPVTESWTSLRAQ